jgi:hypothetical protein
MRRDCGWAARVISKLLGTLGLTRHHTKGEWSGSTRVEHLGCIIDTKLMRFFIAPRKIVRIQETARSLLRQARECRCRVARERLRSFCGLFVSLSLPMPYARFYSRSLYDDMSTRCVDTRGSSRNITRCRLSNQSHRDLKAWQQLAKEMGDGRPIRPLAPDGIMHTDATDVGYAAPWMSMEGLEIQESGATRVSGHGRTDRSAYRYENSRPYECY